MIVFLLLMDYLRGGLRSYYKRISQHTQRSQYRTSLPCTWRSLNQRNSLLLQALVDSFVLGLIINEFELFVEFFRYVELLLLLMDVLQWVEYGLSDELVHFIEPFQCFKLPLNRHNSTEKLNGP